MLFVSHDRAFLRGLSNRVLELGGESGTDAEPHAYPGRMSSTSRAPATRRGRRGRHFSSLHSKRSALSLTPRAPVGEPRVGSGFPRLNRGAALSARLAAAAVDPQLRARIEAARRAAADRGAERLRAREDVGRQQPAGGRR